MAIPNIEFTPFIGPYTAAPVQEIGAAASIARQDYDTAVSNMSSLKQAQANALSNIADFGTDRQLAEEYMNKYSGDLAGIEEAGDYENYVTATQKLNSDFVRDMTPLAERKAYFDQLYEKAYQVDPKNAGRLIKAIKARESNPESSSLIRNEGTGKYMNMANDAKFADILAPSVNLTEKALIYGSKIASDTRAVQYISQTTGKSEDEVISSLVSGKISELGEDKIREALKLSFESDSDIQAYKTRQEAIGKTLGEDSGFDQEYNDAIEAAVATFKTRDENLSQKILNADDFNAMSGGGNRNVDAVILPGNSSAITINNPKDFRNVGKAKEELEKTIADLNVDPRTRELAQDKLNDINYTQDRVYTDLKNKGLINNNDILLLKEYSNLTDRELSLKLGSLTRHANGAELNSELSAEDKKLRKDLTKLQELRYNTNEQLEKTLRENPPISVTFKSYNAKDVGKYSSATGAYQELYADNILNAGYSVAASGEDLQKHLNSNFKEIELPDGDGKFSYSGKFEIRMTNGGYYQGNPITDLVVYGKNEDGLEQPIGTIPITGGEVDNSSMRQVNQEVLDIAKANNNYQLAEYAAQGVLRTTPLPTGETIGELSSRKNIQSIPKGSDRKLITFNDNSEMRVKALDDGQYVLVRVEDGKEIGRSDIFYNQDQMEQEILNAFQPE